MSAVASWSRRHGNVLAYLALSIGVVLSLWRIETTGREAREANAEAIARIAVERTERLAATDALVCALADYYTALGPLIGARALPGDPRIVVLIDRVVARSYTLAPNCERKALP